ncbi:hypothetical protein Glove_495g37 [Diversispora epigaea]|uniref:Uncharacterized protein n=1 Tax=Diversispora epigaea TaxID=1348612 RepID=A0A397GI00_9GLOM|nr:hypothetical protein Glove_495g37 [Diversispora epigaea]
MVYDTVGVHVTAIVLILSLCFKSEVITTGQQSLVESGFRLLHVLTVTVLDRVLVTVLQVPFVQFERQLYSLEKISTKLNCITDRDLSRKTLANSNTHYAFCLYKRGISKGDDIIPSCSVAYEKELEAHNPNF